MGCTIKATTVCDCAGAPIIGVVDFSDFLTCENTTTNQSASCDGNYAVYVTTAAARTFKGYGYSMRKKDLVKYMSFWRTVTETSSSASIDIGSG